MDNEQLLAAIAAQEQLRGIVPDEVIDATIDSLRLSIDKAGDQPQRRRQVTVLFADVSGFTAMSESLDPEIVANLMNRLWAQLDRVVVEHGGRVDKHIGDALMAVWGAEETAEDDAERAVKAALIMQSEIALFRHDAERDLAMRIGINTGPVLVGQVGSTHEVTVMGDAVNTASRLEHAAPRNGILLSHETYRHVRGVFDVDAQPPLIVKGKSEPLRVYAARATKVRAFRLRSRGVEGIETSTIGRDSEFAAMCAAFDRVVTTGLCKPLVIIGDAGVGKSRLLYEFDNWLELNETSVFYFKARATRSRSETRFGLVRDLVAFRARIAEGDTPAAVFEKLRAETAGALDRPETRILGLWLGFEIADPDVSGSGLAGENLGTVGQAHLLAYLRSLASQSPVVMLFEDLHWADGESLRLVEQLPELLEDAPLLMVGATRPRVTDGHIDPALRGPAWDLITLDPLDDEAACDLIAEILKNTETVPPRLFDLVVGRAGGNPFFIEELLKKLMDDGVIDTGTGETSWIIRTDQISDESIPTTLTGILQSRLDSLPLSARRSLQLASVVGRTFWDQAIEHLGNEPATLDDAVSRELVFAQPSSTFSRCSEFTFKHALLHDVVGDTVLLAERPVLHERTAAWLTAVAGDRRDEYLEEIAGHLLAAGREEDASDLLFESAARALDAGDPASAQRLAETGLATRGTSDGAAGAHLTLARACFLLGDPATAAMQADLAMALAEESGDWALLVESIRTAFYNTDSKGSHEQGRALIERGMPIAQRLGGRSLTQMLYCRAWIEFNDGDLDAASGTASKCLAQAEADGSSKELMDALTTSGAIAGACGDHEASIAHNRRIRTVASEVGNLHAVALSRVNEGVTWHRMADASGDEQDYDRAEQQYEAALALTRRMSLVELETKTLGNLAQLRLRRGQTETALVLARDCLRLATATRSRLNQLFALLVYAEARFTLDASSEALGHIGRVANDPGLGRLEAEVADVVDRIRALQTGIDVDAAIVAGRLLDFDAMVRSILDS